MKKIMFNDKFGLTEAVLEGRKTQTRRNFNFTLHKKMNKGEDLTEVFPTQVYFEEEKWKFTFDNSVYLLPKVNYPKYNIGEVVAVAQSYRNCDGFSENGIPRWNEIAISVGAVSAGWDNKMFVRAELMPHQIRITNVRVERLQDISDGDCLKEGINEATREYPWYWFAQKEKKMAFNEPRQAFAHLIDKLSKKGMWESNPFVFVYDFELVK